MSSGDYILLKNNGTTLDEKLVLAENGKVLGFDSSLNPVMLINGGSSSGIPYTGAVSDIDFGAHKLTVGTDFTVLSDGSLGLGTDAPAARLQVNGSSYTEGGDGDVTGDSYIDSADAASVLSFMDGIVTYTPARFAAGDVIGNGQITQFNAKLINLEGVSPGFLAENKINIKRQLGRTIFPVPPDDWNGTTWNNIGYGIGWLYNSGAIATALNILSDGKVGIGTVSPSYDLTVSNANASTTLNLENTVNHNGFLFAANDNNVNTLTSTGSFMFSGSSALAFQPANGQGIQLKAENATTEVFFDVNGSSGSYINTGNVGIGVASPTSVLHLKAGTASASSAPLKFNSGTVLTAAEAGTIEYDGITHYSTHASSERGVLPSVQLITLTSAYTLASQTTIQKLFNSPSNGRLTVSGNTTWFFECAFSLTSLSTTSGNIQFGFGGTAAFTRIKYWATAVKGALTGAGANISIGTTAALTVISASTTTATAHAVIQGKLVIGTAGTLIPSIGYSVAAAAVVGADSYFRIWPAGSSTVQSVGNWS